ncbi:MAG: hypothetical protein H5T41_07665 [Methanomassiliicoccales archaeon]|jgi:DNA-binding transcriptional ArsR family regulator|nr:hypothetical protein [Methanomassiliicoccales archaeon]
MDERKHEEFDAEKVREIFRVLSESVPQLLEKLTKVLYGAEESREYAKAVATFYKALKDAGMTDQQAFELTREYMSNLSLSSLIGSAAGKRTGRGAGGEENLGKAIKEQIEKELRDED